MGETSGFVKFVADAAGGCGGQHEGDRGGDAQPRGEGLGGAVAGVVVVVRDSLKRLVGRFNLALRAWVILDNHYHLLLRTTEGKGLTRFVGQLHGSTSRQLNLWEGVPGWQVWHNYWDTCIRSEGDLWTRFNYVHYNPVKHGYAERPDQWRFSSYANYLRTKGEEWLLDCWQRYPVVDFLRGDDFTG
jgi:putative transposase